MKVEMPRPLRLQLRHAGYPGALCTPCRKCGTGRSHIICFRNISPPRHGSDRPALFLYPGWFARHITFHFTFPFHFNLLLSTFYFWPLHFTFTFRFLLLEFQLYILPFTFTAYVTLSTFPFSFPTSFSTFHF